MMSYRSMGIFSLMALTQACGSSAKLSAIDDAVGNGASKAAVSTPSKMAQQATASSQFASDTSETTTTGTADSSGTSKKSIHGDANGSMTADSSGHGSFMFHGSADLNQTVAADFNTTVHFDGLKGGGSHDSGSASCDVKFHGPGDLNATLTFDVNQTLANGNRVKVSTDPNIAIKLIGTKAAGLITRTLNGTIRRIRTAEDSNGAVVAADANFTFDYTIDHNNTVVADVYTSGTLTARTLSGTVTVKSNSDASSSVVTFTNVLRGAPQTCLCPSAGSVEVKLTDPAGEVHDHVYTFGSTCGQVAVTDHVAVSAAASADANTTAGSSSSTVSSDAAVNTTETWPVCIPN